MNKAWAFVDIVDRFERGAVLRTWDIANCYEVDMRTAQRWLREIEYEWGLERIEGAWRKAR